MTTQDRPSDLETLELLAEARGKPVTRRERSQLSKTHAEEGDWLGAEGDRLLALALVLSVHIEQGVGSERELRSRLSDSETLLVPRRSSDGGEASKKHSCWVLLRSRGEEGSDVEVLAYDTQLGRVVVTEQSLDDLVPHIAWQDSWFRLVSSAEASAGSPEAATPEPAAPEVHPLRLLATLVRPDRKDLVAVVIYAVATGVFLLATPVAVQALVNSIALGGALQPLFVVAVLLLLGLLFAGALRGLQSWVVEILQRRVFARLVAQLGSRLGHAEVGLNDRRSMPELVNRFFDVVTIQKTGAGLLLDGLSVVLSVLVGSAVLAFYHPLLLAFDLILLVAIGLIVFAPLRKGVRTAIAESSAKYEVAAWFEELAGKPRAYRTGGARALVFRRCDEVARKYLTTRAAHFRVLFAQILAALALHAFASTGLLAVGGFLVIQGTLTLGQLVAAELIVNVILASVSKLGKHLENYYDLMAATKKVGALLSVPLEDKGGRSWLEEGREGEGIEVEIRHLDFALEASQGTARLNLHAEPGTRIGLRSSASGFARAFGDLLQKARTRKAGTVLLNGQALAGLHPESVRSQISVLVQAEVVEGTVRRNIGLGRSSVDEYRLQGLLTRLGLADALASLPQALDTPLTPSGLPLTRDEIHALEVARALVVAPGLVVVGESFLHACGTLRSAVEDVLLDEAAPWTLFVVSSDAITLEKCDEVLDPQVLPPVPTDTSARVSGVDAAGVGSE